jgi:hypothetical protein
VVRSTVLAGQVGGAVHLVASRLAGSAWWNDRENDRCQALTPAFTSIDRLVKPVFLKE